MTEPLSAPSQDEAVVIRVVPDRTAADLARDPSADLDQAAHRRRRPGGSASSPSVLS